MNIGAKMRSLLIPIVLICTQLQAEEIDLEAQVVEYSDEETEPVKNPEEIQKEIATAGF